MIVPGGLFLERDFARLGRGRTVVFYDMRGRGRSDRVADSTHVTIEHEVRDLETVRRHIGAERVALVGWSYLGMLVMRYAAEYPGRVTRIVQLGPLARDFRTQFSDSLVAHDSAPVPDPAEVAELARRRAEGLATRDPRADCEADYRVQRVTLVGDSRLAERVPDLCAIRTSGRRRWPGTSRSCSGRSSATRVRRGSATLGSTSPCSLIDGTQDWNAPYGGGREWAAHLPDARLLTVRGAAHMLWLDAPDTVFPAIDRFLKGEWPDAVARVPR